MSKALSVLCIKSVELDFENKKQLFKQMRVKSARRDLTHICEAKVDSKTDVISSSKNCSA